MLMLMDAPEGGEDRDREMIDPALLEEDREDAVLYEQRLEESIAREEDRDRGNSEMMHDAESSPQGLPDIDMSDAEQNPYASEPDRGMSRPEVAAILDPQRNTLTRGVDIAGANAIAKDLEVTPCGRPCCNYSTCTRICVRQEGHDGACHCVTVQIMTQCRVRFQHEFQLHA